MGGDWNINPSVLQETGWLDVVGGKIIAPANIESALRDQELISQALVIGDRRKFLSAVITLEPEALERFVEANGLAGQSDLHANEQVIAAIQEGVNRVNKKFAQVEHIRKFAVLPRDLDQDNGELTPTLKVKRKVINERYATQIEAMYADA